jgi:hypothetical protein
MINSLVAWLGGEAKTVAFAILSGVIGFLAKGFYDLWLASRKDKLERLNQQLKLLYGPLYALNQANNLAWKAFRSRVRPGGSFFRTEPPPSPQELGQWRYWMLKVFRPINEEMLSLITRNVDLLIEDDLPNALQCFCAHVAAYKVVFERWSNDDFSEHTSVVDYPTKEMADYLGESFRRLKAQQAHLLGESSPARARPH